MTVAVYSLTPSSLSLIFPFTERVPLSFVGHDAVLVALKTPYPEPTQSKANVNLAALSTEESRALREEPSLTGPLLVKVAVARRC